MPYSTSSLQSSGKEFATVHGRTVGAHLRHAMEGADLNGKQIARLLGFSESHVSRMITGKQLVNNAEDVASFLAVCGVKGRRRAYLLRMAHERDLTAWDRDDQMLAWRSLCGDARRITEYGEFVIPELLRTDDYAHAVLSRTIGVEQDHVDDLVYEVKATQRIFAAKTPPRYDVLLHEFALHHAFGSKAVMAEQLRCLLDTEDRAGIAIRIIPRDAGAHAGNRGSFCLVECWDTSAVRTADQLNVHFMDHPDGVAVYRRVVDSLAAVALPAKLSRGCIERVAAEVYDAPSARRTHARQ